MTDQEKPIRQLTPAERAEIRAELDDLTSSLTLEVRKAMKSLRVSQNEIYSRKLRP